MTLRPLGKTGLSIAPLMLGGNVFGWTADEPMSFRILDAFVAGGFNGIDTADMYSTWIPGHVGGESETIIGKWMAQRGNRAKVVITTKVGMEMGGTKGLSRARILASAEGSLKRLGTDCIDLYQAHMDDAEVPFEETLDAFATLIKQGKVRAIGASNYPADRLAAALAAARRAGLPIYQTLQPEYNLYDRAGYEAALEPLCRQEGLGVIPYFALASGFLTGKYRREIDLAGKARAFFVKKYLDDRGARILDALGEVAAAHRATRAQVALAWLMARPGITAPIASATSVDQVGELMGAARLSLSAADIAGLDSASASV
ncbi:MAG: aldo/keto reductase [Burkholderiales bacterium]